MRAEHSDIVIKGDLIEVVDKYSGGTEVYNKKDLEFMGKIIRGVGGVEAYIEVFGEDIEVEALKILLKGSRMKGLKQAMLREWGIDLGYLYETELDILENSEDDKARVKIIEMEFKRRGLLAGSEPKKESGRALSKEEREKLDYLFGRESESVEGVVVEDGKEVVLGGVVEKDGDVVDLFQEIPY